MSPIQTEYNERMQAPSPGTVGGSDYGSRTAICETQGGIGFGLACSQGSSSDKGAVIGGTTATFIGISIRDVTAKPAASSPDKYNLYENMGLIFRGQVWASPAVAVQAGDVVHFDGTTGRLSNTGGQLIPGARWVTSAEADGRALVELMAFSET
jgi:hypothetical protein